MFLSLTLVFQQSSVVGEASYDLVEGFIHVACHVSFISRDFSVSSDWRSLAESCLVFVFLPHPHSWVDVHSSPGQEPGSVHTGSEPPTFDHFPSVVYQVLNGQILGDARDVGPDGVEGHPQCGQHPFLVFFLYRCSELPGHVVEDSS